MDGRKLLMWGAVLVGAVLVWHMVGGGGEPRVVLGDGSAVAGDDIATPLVASARVQMRGRVAVFYMALTDAKGRGVRSVRGAGGRPAAPRVVVSTSTGQEVHQATLKYG